MINQYFQKQIDQGATEMFFYALDKDITSDNNVIASVHFHKGTLDSFPTNLEFVRMMTDNTPLFREIP